MSVGGKVIFRRIGGRIVPMAMKNLTPANLRRVDRIVAKAGSPDHLTQALRKFKMMGMSNLAKAPLSTVKVTGIAPGKPVTDFAVRKEAMSIATAARAHLTQLRKRLRGVR